LFAAFNTLEHRQKNSYAMHTIKIIPNLLFEYQCTSGKFIRLPNRIESKLLPELECSTVNVTLLAFAAQRRAAAPLLLSAGCAAVDRYLLPSGRTAANPQQRSAADE